jgi:uncharacterized protein (DUF2336 family)
MNVQRFLHWLETAPKSSRAEAAGALARASLHNDMLEDERDSAEAALTLLLDDPSTKVRYAMADALASHANAPRHLIMALAQDQADIAMLVLCRSPLFLDSELCEIVTNSDSVTLMAIACRQPLSNVVAASVIATGNDGACLALLQNEVLDLSTQNMRDIAKQMGGKPEIREGLLAQKSLPADIRQTLIAGLSSALQEMVVAKSWLSEVRAKKVVREARDRATAQLACAVAVEEIPPLVEHLRSSGQLTTAFLLRTVCSGNIALFTATIANLSRIPEKRIIAVLQQGRTAAFRAIYDRTGLPNLAIPVITAAVDSWRDEEYLPAGQDDVQLQCRVIEQIMQLYLASVSKPDQTLLALLRRISAETRREAALLRVREIARAA